MRDHLLPPAALVAILLTSSPAETQAEPARLDAPPEALGFRTDRLSAQQLERWHVIARLAFAENGQRQPLHPTLRRLWEQVAASGHEVYVELPEPQGSVSNIAGQFRIERVDPEGAAHVGVLRLYLVTIDRVDVQRHKGDAGFRPFDGLGRVERYLEVVGHELQHAVWGLATPERARRAFELQKQLEGLGLALRGTKGDERAQLRLRLRDVKAQAEALEEPAREMEARVWEELLASQAARGVRRSS